MFDRKPSSSLLEWAHPLLRAGRRNLDGFLFLIDVRPNWDALRQVFRDRAVALGFEVTDQTEFIYDVRTIRISGVHWLRYGQKQYSIYTRRRAPKSSSWSVDNVDAWEGGVELWFDLFGDKPAQPNVRADFEELVFVNGAFGFRYDSETKRQVVATCELWPLLDELTPRVGFADWGDLSRSRFLGTFRLESPKLPDEAVLMHELIAISIKYQFLSTDDHWRRLNE